MDLITIALWILLGAAIAWALQWFFWDMPTRAAATRRYEQELTLARNENEKMRVELRNARDRGAVDQQPEDGHITKKQQYFHI